jgi:hypothetical protein
MIIPAILLICAGAGFAQTSDTQQAAAPVDSSHEKITALQGKIDGIEESYLATKATVDKLSKWKLSGYIQAQWRMAMDTTGNIDSNGAKVSKNINYLQPVGNYAGGAFSNGMLNQFQLRRVRLKIGYETELTQYYVQFDASAYNNYKNGTADVLVYGFGIKDAYLALTDPWLKSIGIQAGLFNRPYGYEIEYSSSNRESPERSRLCQTLFPGERDVGAMLFLKPAENMGMLTHFNFKAGLFNGQGINADIDNKKDAIGRLGFTVPLTDINLSIDGGVSAYLGTVTNTDTSLAGKRYDTTYTLTGIDTATGSTKPIPRYKRSIDSTNTTGGTARGFEYEMVNKKFVKSSIGQFNKDFMRKYYGVDLQVYYDMPVIGGSKLLFEYTQGHEPGTSSASDPYNKDNKLGRASNAPVYLRNFMGYSIMLVQNIFNKNQFVLKYDSYDPNTDVAGKDFGVPVKQVDGSWTFPDKLSAADLYFNTLGIGWIYHWDENLKLMLYYDKVTNETVANAAAASVTSQAVQLLSKDYNDDVLTVRLQYKF